MRCHDVEALLPQFAAEELSPQKQHQVARHLDQCDACRHELRSLRTALTALEQAHSTPAPDLWSSFQARLAASESDACAQAITQLSEYLDDRLSEADATWQKQHLEQCLTCARELERLRRPLAALDAVGSPPPPIDLWTSFEHRLSATVSCHAVQSLLPEVVDDPAVLDTPEFRAHLRHCAECAAEHAAFSRALGVLEGVGSRVPAVDLWPSLARKLSTEPPARAGWTAWIFGRTPRWAHLPVFGFTSRVLVPAGMAIAALLLLPFSRPLPFPQTVNRQPEPPRVALTPRSITPTPERQEGANRAPRATSAKTQTARSSRRTVTHRSRLAQSSVIRPNSTSRRKLRRPRTMAALRKATPTRVAVPRRVADPSTRIASAATKIQSDPASDVAAANPTPEFRVAYNPDGIQTIAQSLPQPANARNANLPARPAGDIARTEQEGKEAVLFAVELLAEQEDALLRPFEMTPDADL